MLTAIVLILFGLTTALDWLPGIKDRPKKETAVYGLMLAAALAVLFLYTVDVKVPGPSGVIRKVVESFIPK